MSSREKWRQFLMPDVAFHAAMAVGNCLLILFRLFGLGAPLTRIGVLEYLATITVLGVVGVLLVVFDGIQYFGTNGEEPRREEGPTRESESRTQLGRPRQSRGGSQKNWWLRVPFNLILLVDHLFVMLVFPSALGGIWGPG